MSADVERSGVEGSGVEGAGVEGPSRRPWAARSGVAGGRTVDVDRTGRVRASDGSWWLEWWIGADDRWHHPAREAATRQERLDGMPVFETRLRVPGGDAVQRVYGVHLGRSAGGAGDHLVVEVLNRSRLPFALAVAVGPCRGARLRGTALQLDDRTALRAFRAPSRWAAGASPDALYDLVEGGGSEEVDAGVSLQRAPLGAEGGDGGAVAALWPLAHGAGLRLLLPLDPTPTAEPAAVTARSAPWPVLPDAEQVARGWRRQIEAACRVQLPEEALQARLDSARAALGLEVPATPDDPVRLARLVGALAGWGQATEARRALGRVSQLAADDRSPATQAAFLTAVAAYRRETGDGEVAAAALEEVARAAAVVHRALGRRRWRRLGIGAGSSAAPAGGAAPSVGLLLAAALAAAELLTAAGEPAPAPHAERSGPDDPFGRAEWTVAGVPGPEVSDPLPLVDAVHAMLIGATAGRDRGSTLEVALAPGWRDTWRGRPLEVHRLRCGAGAVSYALRWHGERPALLWDVEPSPLLPPGVVPLIHAPGLAPGWTARSWRGEALLDPGR